MERAGPSARLRAYLAELPPAARSLLTREFERALARGEDNAVASFVLAELRALPPDGAIAPAADPVEQFFRVLQPFVVDAGRGTTRPGQIRRTSLDQIWIWLQREAMVAEMSDFITAYARAQASGNAAASEQAVRALQVKASAAIASAVPSQAAAFDRPKSLARIGSPETVADLPLVGLVFAHRDAFEKLVGHLPNQIRDLDEGHVTSITAALDNPELSNALALPLALVLIGNRLASHWQLIRLAIAHARTDDDQRVAATPFGVAVGMVLDNVIGMVGELIDDLRRGRLDNVVHRLKLVHDALRGLRTEIDIRQDSAWGRQLAAIRTSVSDGLTAEIEAVPGRVRRILRQRPDKDITGANRISQDDVAEVAGLIEFVGACRNHASELAINEVTLRAYTDLQQYLETATRALVESLRVCDPRVLDFRRAQAEAGISLCAVMFGQDYAAIMTKAVDVALSGERKPAKTG